MLVAICSELFSLLFDIIPAASMTCCPTCYPVLVWWWPYALCVLKNVIYNTPVYQAYKLLCWLWFWYLAAVRCEQFFSSFSPSEPAFCCTCSMLFPQTSQFLSSSASWRTQYLHTCIAACAWNWEYNYIYICVCVCVCVCVPVGVGVFFLGWTYSGGGVPCIYKHPSTLLGSA